MKRELSLNDRQTKAIYNLCIKRFEIIGQAGKALDEQVQIANDTCASKIRSILTPDQYRTYQQLRAETKRQEGTLEPNQSQNAQARKQQQPVRSRQDYELDL